MSGKATGRHQVVKTLGNHSAAIPEDGTIRQMNDLRHCSISYSIKWARRVEDGASDEKVMR